MRVAIYTRVSTNHQTTENQRLELRRVAECRGWKIVKEYTDDGISGAKGRDQRPALDAMLKAATRRDFDLVATFAVDRLGRSLQNLLETVNELHSVRCDLYLHQQAIDTSTPAGRLAFSVFGAMAEFERSLIRERVAAGLARAKANGTKLGRPSNMNDGLRAAIVALRGKGQSIRQISAGLGVGVGSVYRVLQAAGLATDTKVAA
jgi:DNA invertase Pin-like site-specific DNA recombinase